MKEMRKVLSGYEMKFVGANYTKVDVSDGYQCGCGGDDHDLFVDLHGCECYCHGENI